MAGEVLQLATGLIVALPLRRAACARDRLRGADPPHRPSGLARPRGRAGHGRRSDPLFGCFGNLNDGKRIPQLLRAFDAGSGAAPRGARLLLVGGGVRAARARSTCPEGVVREDYVDEQRLWSLMAACDAIVSLRWPTMGETSGTAIRALGLGKPLVVSDVGWFSELPDEVALKVPVDEREQETLAAALEALTDETDADGDGRSRARARRARARARPGRGGVRGGDRGARGRAGRRGAGAARGRAGRGGGRDQA